LQIYVREEDGAALHLDTAPDGRQSLTLQLSQKATELAIAANPSLTAAVLRAPILLAEYDPTERILKTYPTVTKAGKTTFAQPKYRFDWISFENMEPIEDEGTPALFLGKLPVCFEVNAFDGLGAYWGLRFIFEVLDEVEFEGVCISRTRQEFAVDNGVLHFPLKLYDEVRRAINRGHAEAVGFANEDKVAYLRGMLLPPLMPDVKIHGTFQQSVEDLRARVSGALLRPGNRRHKASNGAAAVRAVRLASKELAEQQPSELYSLTRTVEAVTLERLIEKFAIKLDEGHTESHWQKFLVENPFILRMGFGLPIAVFGEQVSVGGTGFQNSGGKLADFVIQTGLQGNLGVIEIKKPATLLVEAKPYRGKVHAPSKELAGAVNQVLDQRYRLQQEITQKKESDNVRDVYAYSVGCLVIAGRNPDIVEHKKSFELFRTGQRDVTIVTFDELLAKLRALYEFLSKGDEAIASPAAHGGEDDELEDLEDLEA
jgi:hypothetical protein